MTKELEHYFTNNTDPDYITFLGLGEPTLNSRIGDVLHFIKHKKPNIPVAVLTNDTLLFQKHVRTKLLIADVVLPSLNASINSTFIKINRAYHTLHIYDYIRGLEAFRKEFTGQIWLEILIIPGYNDSEKEQNSLKNAFERNR